MNICVLNWFRLEFGVLLVKLLCYVIRLFLLVVFNVDGFILWISLVFVLLMCWVKFVVFDMVLCGVSCVVISVFGVGLVFSVVVIIVFVCRWMCRFF